MYLPLKIEIFKEGDVFVSISPQLNVSSFGDTVEEARASLREAIESFIEECQAMGTLDEVLEEAGFNRTNEDWEPRRPVLEDRISLSI
jgi:predicted RNase H-like HicB family nuclease